MSIADYDELRTLLGDGVDGLTLGVAEQIAVIGQRYQDAGAKAYWNGDLFGVHYARGARDACNEIARVMRDAVVAARARAHAGEEGTGGAR